MLLRNYFLILNMLTENLLIIIFSMFFSVDPSLTAGIMARLFVHCGFPYDFTESQAASCIHFQGQ
jgi:hypothetical protein